MTPTQHKAAAETLTTTISASPDTATRTTVLRARAHATLGASAGSGAHYTAADALLTGLASSPDPQRAERAVAHATLVGATGSGAHFTAADAALTDAARPDASVTGKAMWLAGLHALLADR